MAEQMHPKLKRRILMFYFAAGINLIMALWVMSAGSAQAASGALLAVISLGFLLFAGINFFLAKRLRKQWEEAVRQRAIAQGANE